MMKICSKMKKFTADFLFIFQKTKYAKNIENKNKLCYNF